MPHTEQDFRSFLNSQSLSVEVENRYPTELTRLQGKGYDFYAFDNTSSDSDINLLLDSLLTKGGTSIIYDVGLGGQTVPNGRNPKYFDSAELVIRVIKLYLLFIGKTSGNVHRISSIRAINSDTEKLIKLLEIFKTQYRDLFWIFYNLNRTSGISGFTSILKGINKIFYGVPGCGKSFHVKKLVDNIVSPFYYERTIFYPDYSYSDFVGQLVPTKNGTNITYDFKPGIFTTILTKALQDPDHDYYLVIEEINRGNASAIFGDLFQLLDRDSNYESVYAISQLQIQEYLADKVPNRNNSDLIKIPKNLNIYATMNTSDQNVFVLDTAFKRRWEFELIPNNISNFSNASSLYVPNTSITWQEFHIKINKKIVSNQVTFGNFDDKQIGPFFIDSQSLSTNQNDTSIDKIYKFSYKVLEYLWNDVARLYRDKWFGNNVKTLEELIKEYEINGFSNFPNGLID